MTARKTNAFTLIELLVVIGILAILLTITLIAINPGRQFSQSNDTKRSSDVNAILNAVHQYAADHKGVLPGGITSTATAMGNATGLVDFCSDVVPLYLAAFPVDPQTNNGAGEGAAWDCTGTDVTTNYTILTAANNRITVAAPDAEINIPISVTR